MRWARWEVRMSLVDLHDRYTQDGFLFLKGFFPFEAAASLRAAADTLPGKRVEVNDTRITWWEQCVPNGHPLDAIFCGPKVMSVVRTALGQTRRRRLDYTVWVSTYRLGEYVNEHKDRDGIIQIVLGLQAGPAECGGESILRITDRIVRVFLTAGDLLVFDAASIPHSTTPVCAGPDGSVVNRVVAVARYYE